MYSVEVRLILLSLNLWRTPDRVRRFVFWKIHSWSSKNNLAKNSTFSLEVSIEPPFAVSWVNELSMKGFLQSFCGLFPYEFVVLSKQRFGVGFRYPVGVEITLVATKAFSLGTACYVLRGGTLVNLKDEMNWKISNEYLIKKIQTRFEK